MTTEQPARPGDADAPELPHALALAWGVAANPQRGPRRELSIERIVDAAIELADADGIDGVSMAKVAQRLGYTTMSLYRYVTSKDDLLLLMQEQALDVEAPPAHEPPDWRTELREWMAFVGQVLAQHPWYLDIPVTGAPLTPNNLRLVDAGLRALRSTPLDHEEKMSVILLGSSYSKSAAELERDLARAVAAAGGDDTVLGGAYDAILRELVDDVRFPYLYPLVASGAYVGEGQIDDTAFGRERLLDGVAAYVDARAAGAPGQGRPFEGTAGVSGIGTGTSDGVAGASGGVAGAPGAAADDPDLRAARAHARDPRVKQAAEKRREAEKRLREGRKKVRELEKELREAEKSEREAARDAARAARG